MTTEVLLEVAQEEDNKLSPITKFESAINKMKAEYSGLTIFGQEDKEGFLKVSNARKAAKSLRVEVEHRRKALNEDALKWQRTVNEKAKEITAKIEEIEKPLQKLEDEYLAEKERIKEEAARLLRERTQNRARVITSFDQVKFDGVIYSLGDFSITQVELESLSDDDFQTRVEVAEFEVQKILAARIEAERLAKIEAERLEAERIQKEAEEAEIKRQQEEVAAELKRQQDELAAERKRIEDEKAAIEAEKKRIQDEKDAAIKAENDRIAAEAAEKKRLEELEVARVEAAEKARIAAENKAKADAEAKAEADRLAKEKEEKRLARRPDIEKQKDMMSQITAVVGSFSYKTEEGKKMQADFSEGLERLIEAVGIKEI